MTGKFLVLLALLVTARLTAFCQDTPDADAFRVIKTKQTRGPSITGYLQYQTAQAWMYDDLRQDTLANITEEKSLDDLKASIKEKLLSMIGGLPKEKTPLNPKITGKIQMTGFHIEKLIFESIPGFHVTALVYVPDDGAKTHPAILVPCGHSQNGKIHYQQLCQRLVKRGYLVISWDPVGQGERSQFWDEQRSQSRYNLVCGEHAVLGNFAYLAGANLMRWEIWDGIRAVDYLISRPDVDADRISITGTSGGGAQAAHIGALDERIKVVAPSCYITNLPMRAYNRIFADPDGDPEQDLYGMVSEGVDHTGLLLLIYPRPVFIASAVLDFFPIEGTRKTFREVSEIYGRFGKRDNIAMIEGYHKHQFSVENQQTAFDFIDRHNSKLPQGPLPQVADVDPEQLWCTQKRQVSLEFSDEKNLMDLIQAHFLEREPFTSYVVTDKYYGKDYPNVKNWKITEYKGNPPTETIAWEKKGQSQFKGITIDQYLLRHSTYLQMPVLYFHSSTKKSDRTTLWINLNGKASQQHWKEIAERVSNGENVMSFDFRGTGEDRMQYEATSSDDLKFDNVDSTAMYFNPLSSVFGDYVYNTLLMGRPYFLQMIEDTEIAVSFARDQLGSKKISFTGTEEAQLLIQQISKTLPGIEPVTDTNKGVRWSQIMKEKREVWPIQYLLPGGAYVK